MIKLQIFTVSDFSHLKKWVKTKEELIQFAGPIFKFPLTIDQIEKYLEDKKRNVFKVIVHYEDSFSTIGIAELYDYSDDTNKIARVLIGEKTFRGKGIGTNLIIKLVEYSFENDNKEIVTLNVYDWNISAIKCYEKVGFSKTEREPKITNIADTKWQAIEMEIKRQKEASR